MSIALVAIIERSVSLPMVCDEHTHMVHVVLDASKLKGRKQITCLVPAAQKRQNRHNMYSSRHVVGLGSLQARTQLWRVAGLRIIIMVGRLGGGGGWVVTSLLLLSLSRVCARVCVCVCTCMMYCSPVQ